MSRCRLHDTSTFVLPSTVNDSKLITSSGRKHYNSNSWKYIPYSNYNTKGVGGGHYDARKAFSFGLPIIIIIGARDLGKTFAAKKFCLKKFVGKNEKFVWLRDNDEARKKLALDNGSRFFSDVPAMEIFGYKDGTIKGEVIYCNGSQCGYLMPSSTFQNYKGSGYNDITNIVYDEFIRELNRNKRVNGAWEIVNSLFTIVRHKKKGEIRIIMTANALDLGDDFLNFIGVTIRDFGFYVNRDSGIVIHYSDNSANFNKKMSDSVIGNLIQNSKFEDNLLKSKFKNETDLFFDKMPEKCRVAMVLCGNLTNVRVYTDGALYYVTNDANPNTYRNKRFVVNISDASVNMPVLPLWHRKLLRELVQENRFRYKNKFYQKFILDI